jgi:hypothetical protein
MVKSSLGKLNNNFFADRSCKGKRCSRSSIQAGLGSLNCRFLNGDLRISTGQERGALSTEPGVEYEGEVVEVERTAEARGEEGTTVLVRVAIDRDRIANLRSDTTVTAKVHCGTRSLGYVWFCDLIETVQTHILFWL